MDWKNRKTFFYSQGNVRNFLTDRQRKFSQSLFYFSSLFGSFGNEPMQSCSVRRVSLSLLASASVYSPPSDRFDHRSFISYKYMQLCPWCMHMKY